MAGIGVMPGYVSAVNAYRQKKAAKPTSFGAALGTSPATKAGLLPTLEGGLGLGLPKVAAPKSLVPQVNIPKATVAPTAGPSTPDYQRALEDDPTWQLARKNYEDALAMGERSTFGDPFKQLLTQYGYVPNEDQINALSPDLQAMVRKYLTPDAIAAARDNPYSTAATINKSFDKALAGVPIEYAERGLLNAEGKLSGGAAIAASTLGYQRGQQAAQTMDEFLRGIGSANSNWLNYQNTQANAFRQAQEDVATRLSNEEAPPLTDPASFDYSGGPSAIFQPSPAVGAILDNNAATGRNDAWAAAMQRNINAANKPSAKTKKIIKKVKGR